MRDASRCMRPMNQDGVRPCEKEQVGSHLARSEPRLSMEDIAKFLEPGCEKKPGRCKNVTLAVVKMPLNKFNEQENIEANPQLQRARRG